MLFFLNDTATTEIYTLSLTTLFRSPAPERPAGRTGPPARDRRRPGWGRRTRGWCPRAHTARRRGTPRDWRPVSRRSEEHTSELQSRRDLVCRLLLEKKKRTWRGGRS